MKLKFLELIRPENEENQGLRANFTAESYNKELGTVDVVLSSEKSALMYDWDYGLVDEILVNDGVTFRSENLVLLNSHNRSTCEDVLGSIRDLKIENEKVIGKVFFDLEDENARKIAKKVQNKHITDISIGYTVEEKIYVSKGDSYAYKDKVYKASDKRTLRLITRHVINEGSFTPIGANEEALARAKALNKENTVVDLEKEQKEQKELKEKQEKEKQEKEKQAKTLDNSSLPDNSTPGLTEIKEIVSLCRQFNVSADQFLVAGVTLDSVRAKILADLAKDRSQNDLAPIELVEDQIDSTRKFVENSLAVRLGMDVPHKDTESSPHRLLFLAREYLKAQNYKADRLPANEIAQVCFKRQVYAHGTDDFPALLADSANKRLQKAYQETPSTYQFWVYEGDVPDFKDINVVRLSEGEDLALIPEFGKYPEESYSEEKETYSVDTYGKIFSITRKTLINDDLRGIARAMDRRGSAGKRTLNKVVYAKLIGNPEMSDGKALFHADHNNLENPGTALNYENYGKARAKIALQKGLSDTILNLEPAWLIVPRFLEATARQIVVSSYVPETQKGHIDNIWKGSIKVIPEGLLDAASSTAWYLAVAAAQIDTVEVSYLEGTGRQPELFEEEGFIVDGRRYKVRFEFGVGAIDYRGLYLNPGA